MKLARNLICLSASLLAIVALAGCKQGARSLPLDQDVARQSLETFLKSWKEGKKPADLKNATPSIVVGDPDWEAGKTLVDYKRLPEERSDGTNLHTSVEATLTDASGATRTRTINYIVGTSPVITIFRP